MCPRLVQVANTSKLGEVFHCVAEPHLDVCQSDTLCTHCKITASTSETGRNGTTWNVCCPAFESHCESHCEMRGVRKAPRHLLSKEANRNGKDGPRSILGYGRAHMRVIVNM